MFSVSKYLNILSSKILDSNNINEVTDILFNALKHKYSSLEIIIVDAIKNPVIWRKNWCW